MIDRIQDFFGRFIEPAARQPGAAGDHALRVATAALLLEMMRMDNRYAPEEHAAVAAALESQFRLDGTEVAALVALAEEEAREASGYYQFTSLINKTCDAGQKARIVEYLWRVALADGHLDAHELHLMRKIADLLYVSHADYLSAKQRVRAAMGVPPGG